MIITRIYGGLGNQLFQYAAATALAIQNKADVKLDLSAFDAYRLRSFELDQFNLQYAIATAEEIQAYKATTTLQRIQARITPATKKAFYKQPYFHFDPRFFSLRSPVYLQGYFQSEKFFQPAAETIRQQLTFREPFRHKIKDLAGRLSRENTVAVHIRRGDYANAEALRMHGVLPESYYQRAAAELKGSAGAGLRIYLFSDDPTAALHFGLANAELISGNYSQNHFEDLYLMSQCRHNIIANSSFSWWAAWLNNHPNKTVIAPRQWFNKGPKDTQDLFPGSWICL